MTPTKTLHPHSYILNVRSLTLIKLLPSFTIVLQKRDSLAKNIFEFQEIITKMFTTKQSRIYFDKFCRNSFETIFQLLFQVKISTQSF